MTPPDYEYLRKLLKDHSGLDLSADKQYLIESRLLPLSRKCGLPGGDQPKVVFCTTENNVAHIAQALSGGANEYIMKPFDKDIIADKFAEVGLLPVGQAMV